MEYRSFRSFSALLCTLSCAAMLVAAAAADGASDAEVKSLLTEGDKLLLKGRSSYQEAIAKYTQAINLQPQNEKALYRRAELASMMKNFDLMTADLDAVLKIDPKHRQGLTLRSKHRAATGDFLAASADFRVLESLYAAQKKDSKAAEARSAWQELHRLGEQWNNIQHHLANRELTYEQRKQVNQECVNVLSGAISLFAKDNVELRLRRAECALAARDQVALTDEVKFVLKRDSSNLRAIALGAKAFRALGAIDQAKSEVKRCLALDQEDATCRHLHKAIRAYEKQMSALDAALGEKKWDAVVREIDVALGMEEDPPNPEQLWRHKCDAYVHLRDIKPGLEACTRYIEIEPSTLDGLLWRADIHILDDNLEAAQADVRKADEFHNNNQRVREHQQKIENLKRMASRKDYYKILGVKKTASDQEIRRAFRKLAMTLHPDQMRSKDISEEERAKNDALFRDINEAKEVLLDEEKRRRFDNGEDVTKPADQQQQHGGFHFPHGGNFHFHFG